MLRDSGSRASARSRPRGCRRRTPRAARARRARSSSGAHDLAVRADALVDLDHALVEQRSAARSGARRASAGSGRRCAARRAKPRVITSAVRSPLRSSSALVATVVPILTASIASAGIGAPAASPSSSRMPCTAASRYRSGFSDSSLCVASVPSGRRATMSVNVPPRSIQNCQRMAWHQGRSRIAAGRFGAPAMPLQASDQLSRCSASSRSTPRSRASPGDVGCAGHVRLPGALRDGAAARGARGRRASAATTRRCRRSSPRRTALVRRRLRSASRRPAASSRAGSDALAAALPVPVLTSALLQAARWCSARFRPAGASASSPIRPPTSTRRAAAPPASPPDTPVDGVDPDGVLRAHDPPRRARRSIASAMARRRGRRRAPARATPIATSARSCSSARTCRPTRDAVRDATGLPVFDAADLVRWFHAGLPRRRRDAGRRTWVESSDPPAPRRPR